MESPRLLQGFRDYLPSDMADRQWLLQIVSRVYQEYGFWPLDTPALELAELLVGKYGEEEKLIYRFRDHGQREVAMRYDLTVPLARVMANHSELPLPFKRYQAALVWRADSPQRGRYREFMQFDVDTVGSADILADVEIVQLIRRTLKELGQTDFTISLSHRGVVEAIFEAMKIDQSRRPAIFRHLDKINKVSRQITIENLSTLIGQNMAMELLSTLTGPETYSRLEKLLGDDPSWQNLRQILDLLMFDQQSDLCLDLSIVRGLDYYTGLVFETTLAQAPEIGSIFSGGRYDKLMHQLAGRDLPAVGASIGVDRLLSVLKGSGTGEQKSCCLTVFAGLEKESLALAERLRSEHLEVILILGRQKLAKQLHYANVVGATSVIIYGEQEQESQTYLVREMKSGQQIRVEDFTQLVKIIGGK